jgi:hypothetical protein
MNTRTGSKHMEKMLLAGTMAVLLLAALLGTAVAQERDVVEEKVRPAETRNKILVVGVGVAVETDDNSPYRSQFRLAIAPVQGEDNEYEVKRGVVVINDEGSPVRYHVIPDTWEVKVREDNSAFTAEGMVEDEDGNTFEVSLEGELLREIKHGWLYIAKGKFEGGDLEYDLYYIAAAIKRTAVQPAEVTARG